ncbi:MAG: hypothetical protein KJ723_05005 [candidate division Zixibacteria bacterium]|nr:hypothetical protein [candidate division Zixibacteria bacterium]
MQITIGLASHINTIDLARITDLDFLLLPEMFNCVYTPDKFEVVDDTDGTIEKLKAISAANPRLHLIAGTLPITDEDDGELYNRSLTFRNGEVIHSVSKIHLFRPIKDDRLFKKGSYVGNFSTMIRENEVLAGIAICYDLRFPELIRRMTLERLQVLFVPAHWAKAREFAWKTLLCARAIENQVFVVGLNNASKSFCFAPEGECRYESEDIVDFATFEIDLNEIDESKKLFNTRFDTELL